MTQEVADANEVTTATVQRNGGMTEAAEAHGVYHIVCYGPDGEEKWSEVIDNLVTTVGKNFALTTYLTGSGYTVTGPYMGLIGAVSYTTGPASGDTMSSHSGWTEAGGTNAPTYSGNRPTMSFGAASAGAITTSAAVVFSITGTGTAKGVFVVTSTGAVNTKDDTNGTLYSAGLFSGGDRSVGNGDTLNVTYTASL
jgi:hypothetical protein